MMGTCPKIVYEERMDPQKSESGVFWEHVFRYQFAAGYVSNRTVLDVACGYGYGTAGLIAAGAKSAFGLDSAPAACRRAKEQYGVDAAVGDACSLRFPDGSFDVVVSFETIEHVRQRRC